MSDLHYPFWPKGLPKNLTLPQTTLHANLEISARKYPNKPALIYYGYELSYQQLLNEVEKMAAYLQQECGIKKGDRVLLYLQNSPQFVIAFYAILRADAVVVPINPMNKSEELAHYIEDTGATTIFVAQDLYSHLVKLNHPQIQRIILTCYADYLPAECEFTLPLFVSADKLVVRKPKVVAWQEALATNLQPAPSLTEPDDLCVMPYTSGTTGHPKGCMHTHGSVMYNTLSGITWYQANTQDSVYLAALPFFHVTGMQGNMNSPIYIGATVIIMSRWDREVALALIERYRISRLALIAAMVVDLLASPNLDKYDLSSVSRISGGGAAMPEPVAKKLDERFGLKYIEGYGMSELMAASHINPEHRPKRQCLGVPIFDVDARIIDVDTLQELPQGKVGEIIVHGPQMMKGYWNNPKADQEVFLELDGKTFIRTGDIGRIDEDGYFFMVDRLKRMINASGFKVWPVEVESLMYKHPAILEACVVGAQDEKRGETVKAVVVLKADYPEKLTEQELISWCKEHIAAYKVPQIIEFIEELPKTASGKICWRDLQN